MSPACDLPGLPRDGLVAVVAPHPDDEVFGAGGLMMALQRRNCRLRIIAVTDGEASHANSNRITPDELRIRRREETCRAYDLLGISPDVCRLGLPDSGVAAHSVLLRGLLRVRLPGAALCLAPLETDGHPDHDAAASATLAVCLELGVPVWRYAVWSRLHPERIVQGKPSEFEVPADLLERKRAAVRVYTSQLQALGELPQDGPVLPRGFLDYFTEEREPLWPA